MIGGFTESILPPATVILVLKFKDPIPEIVEVPALAVLIVENVLATSMFKVPPALIITAVFAGILLAKMVLPLVIVVCAKPATVKSNPITTWVDLNRFELNRFVFIVRGFLSVL